MSTKKMKLKNPKKKKNYKKIKLFIYLSLIYLGFSFSFYYSIKNNKTISNEEFINLLISSENGSILSNYKTTNLINYTMKFLFNIDFKNPKTILNSTILKYGSNKETTKTISLEYNDDYSNMKDLENISDYIKDPNPSKVEEPIIYIYNSHQLENYSNDNLDIYGITPNVMMASYVLREDLNKLNIPSIVEESNMSDILAKNNWNYSYSYQASRTLIEEKKNKYSTLKYYIDIHRDSVLKKHTQTTINDKAYAKILFVVGKDYTTWESNYNLANNLNNLFNKYYPTLSRGVMLKTGENVNGIYNQDLSPNAILLEIGGVENNIEEVYNTILALSDILSKYIKGEE